MTWIEVIATAFGVLCVSLTIKQNILCWPTGLVQVFLYIFVFYEAKLYADMGLHVIYVGLSIYGWISWRKFERSEQRIVTRSKDTLLWLFMMLIATVVCGYSLTTFTDASVAYLDSFVVMASLIAQWLMARKKLESWFFWILADIVAIGVYSYKALYLTSALYFSFLILAITGYFTWRKGMRTHRQPAAGMLTT
jgi:nicotinamide mononucleotide transporter